MVLSRPAASLASPSRRLPSQQPQSPRWYRLVDGSGSPHPVLDGLYDSLDAAWAEARAWWNDEFGATRQPVEIGVEVSTASGDWRTLRFPGA